MMTNNDVLQGQKYTNGVGTVPQWMMPLMYVPYRWRAAVSSLSTEEHSASQQTTLSFSGRNTTGSHMVLLLQM